MTISTRAWTAGLLCGGLLLGCANLSDNEKRAWGAAGGAATGAVLGRAIGGSGTSAAIGAGAGLAAGLITAEILVRTERARSVDEDASLYGYSGGQDIASIRINDARTEPPTVKSGDTVKLKTDYSLRLPASQAAATVSETFSFRKADEDQPQPFPSEPVARDAGGWVVEADFEVPRDAEPGAYLVTHHVAIENGSYDERITAFNVVP